MKLSPTYFLILNLLLNLNIYLESKENEKIYVSNKDEMPRDAKIYIAGHRGLVGASIVRLLNNLGYKNIITRTHEELDLCDQKAVNNFIKVEKPDYVVVAAAKVGGIYANYTEPADFIYNNIMISTNIIHASYINNVKKLLFLGSSCIYPRECPQPIKEEYLLSSQLEETNKPYALAKIAALNMCHSYNKQYKTKFISCMPTNLYGPGDNFDLKSSHVIPGLIARFCEAQQEDKKEVQCWGTGKALREFMHVDDFARAAVFLLNNFSDYSGTSWINVGSGQEICIRDLINMIKELVGFKGEVVFDSSKPDGTPRKLLCTERINALGWKAEIPLYQGLKQTIDWYKNNKQNNK